METRESFDCHGHALRLAWTLMGCGGALARPQTLAATFATVPGPRARQNFHYITDASPHPKRNEKRL